jgi:hypothetical protein
MGHTMLDSPVERGAVGTSLATGNDFLHHDDCLHCVLTRVQSEIMNALTLRPTWAWLVVNGHKDIENRSWPSRLRGRTWIHASSSRVTKAEHGRLLTICRERRIKRFPHMWV